MAWYLFVKKENPTDKKMPAEWKDYLGRKVAFYQALSKPEQSRFEQAIMQFFNDVTISGAGIQIDDFDRLLVGASAVIPLFGFPGWRYRNLNEVLLYEGTFDEDYDTKGKERNILGMVGSGAMNRIMILSKPALHQGFENQRSKNNVGIHEFVHLLDKADGATDGIPEVLMQGQYAIPWVKLIHQEIQAIKTDHSDINPYGATNEAEFLSVVSEYFFNQPHLFEEKHPELFSMLEKIYRIT
ncbi:MAG: zinc-dependent peptidase [Saprospiraceae bacterium]|nr:zinc-dependent peptidase [Saprospiraceae bacterium]